MFVNVGCSPRTQFATKRRLDLVAGCLLTQEQRPGNGDTEAVLPITRDPCGLSLPRFLESWALDHFLSVKDANFVTRILSSPATEGGLKLAQLVNCAGGVH